MFPNETISEKSKNMVHFYYSVDISPSYPYLPIAAKNHSDQQMFNE